MTSEGWIGPRLWASLARHAIPVVGVLFLDWLALDVLLFLVLETWLFLTLRASVEATLSPSIGPVPETTAGKLGQLAFMGVMCGGAFALILGLVSLVLRRFAFRDADWQRFLAEATWTTPAFRIAVAILVIELAWDAGRFAVRIAPLHAPDVEDDLQLQRMVLRIVMLAVAGFAAGLSPFGTGGGRAIVVGLSAAMVLLDAWPDDALARMPVRDGPVRPPTDADAGAGAPRRSRRRRARSARG